MRRFDKLQNIERINRLCESRYLAERRSVSGVMNPNEDIGTLLTLLDDKYGFENCYVSFRDTLHVGKINPNNEFNTPTGLYTYKLSKYISKPTYDKNAFRNEFPFATQRPYAQFLVVRDDAKILNSKTPSDQLSQYVSILRKKYGELEMGGTSISNLCDNWDDGSYQSYYGASTQNTHKFWLFIFDVAAYVKVDKGNKSTKSYIFSSICRSLGVDGFDDDECAGWIHPSEKCQTVFFKANLFKDQYEILLNSWEGKGLGPEGGKKRRDRYDVSLSDDEVLDLLSRGKIRMAQEFDEIFSRVENPKIAKYIKSYMDGMSPVDLSNLLYKSDNPKLIRKLMGKTWDELIPEIFGDELEKLFDNKGVDDDIVQLFLGTKSFMTGISYNQTYRLLVHSSDPKALFKRLLEFDNIRELLQSGKLLGALLHGGNLQNIVIDVMLHDERFEVTWESAFAMLEAAQNPKIVIDQLSPELLDKLVTHEMWVHNLGDMMYDMRNPDEFITTVGDRLFSHWRDSGVKTHNRMATEILNVTNWNNNDRVFKYVLSKDYIVGDGLNAEEVQGFVYRSKDRDAIINVMLDNQAILSTLDDESIQAIMKASSEPGRIVRKLKTVGKGIKGNTDVTSVD